ncbi:MAG: hypothetical protein ACJA1F_002169 [Paracoccaceae bacterium]|jgi:hypothetical protein
MLLRCRWLIGRALQLRNLRDVTRITRHRNSTGHFAFQTSMNAHLIRCPEVRVYMRERGLLPAKKI